MNQDRYLDMFGLVVSIAMASTALACSHPESKPSPITSEPIPSASISANAIAAPSSSAAAPLSAAPLSTAPKVDCPRNLMLKKDAELEALVAKNDLCAMAELGTRVGRGRYPERYRRAAELIKRAYDGGVATECSIFYDGLGIPADHALAAACLERGGYSYELATLVISGDGVPRDLDRAEKLVSGPDSTSCTPGLIRELIKTERANPTKKVYSFCDDVACTTREVGFCSMRKELLSVWQATQKQEPSIASMTDPQRALYNQLLAAFDKYLSDDNAQHAYIYIGGTWSGILAVERRRGIGDEFDELFDKIVVQHSVAPASKEELDKARAELASAEKTMLGGASEKIGRFDPANHRKLWAASKACWSRYRDTWIALGSAMGTKDEGVRRGLEVLVTRTRVKTLDTGIMD